METEKLKPMTDEQHLKSLRELDMHYQVEVSPYVQVMRVPGGVVYINYCGDPGSYNCACAFVPIEGF